MMSISSVMCANQLVKGDNTYSCIAPPSIINVKINDSVFEHHFDDGLSVRIREIGASRPIYDISISSNSGLKYDITLSFPERYNNESITPGSIKYQDGGLSIMDKNGRTILFVNYEMIKQVKKTDSPSFVNPYEYVGN